MRAILVFLVLWGAAWSSHAEELGTMPMDAATVSKAQSRARENCAESRQKASTAAGEYQIATARQAVVVACDCMPAQIEKAARTFKGIGLISADASRLHQTAAEVCAAREFRSL